MHKNLVLRFSKCYFLYVICSDINMITGERLTGEKGQFRERGPSASSTDNSSHHASPQRRPDPAPEDPLDINGNRSSSEGPINDTTTSNSQETVLASDSRGYERKRGEALQELERHTDSSQTFTPRARSSSRHRYPSNSPDARSKQLRSPEAERPANRELRRVNDEGESGEAASIPSRSSPVPHSSRNRPDHNCESVHLSSVVALRMLYSALAKLLRKKRKISIVWTL